MTEAPTLDAIRELSATDAEAAKQAILKVLTDTPDAVEWLDLLARLDNMVLDEASVEHLSRAYDRSLVSGSSVPSALSRHWAGAGEFQKSLDAAQTGLELYPGNPTFEILRRQAIGNLIKTACGEALTERLDTLQTTDLLVDPALLTQTVSGYVRAERVHLIPGLGDSLIDGECDASNIVNAVAAYSGQLGIAGMDWLLRMFAQTDSAPASVTASAYSYLTRQLAAEFRDETALQIVRQGLGPHADNQTLSIMALQIMDRLQEPEAMIDLALDRLSDTVLSHPAVEALLLKACVGVADPRSVSDRVARSIAETNRDGLRLLGAALRLRTDGLDALEAEFKHEGAKASVIYGLGRPILQAITAIEDGRVRLAAFGRFYGYGLREPGFFQAYLSELVRMNCQDEAVSIVTELARSQIEQSDATTIALTAQQWELLSRASPEAMTELGFSDRAFLLDAALTQHPGYPSLTAMRVRQIAAVTPGLPSYFAPAAVDFDAIVKSAENAYFAMSNPLAYYERLLITLSDLPATQIVPLSQLVATDPGDGFVISVRHDIDAKPRPALNMARLLAQYDLPSSFYLLHTAPYYMSDQAGMVQRNPRIRDWVDGFAQAGVELGLHTDALGYQFRTGVPAIEVLEAELTWLREVCGAHITGTVAHGSLGAQNAENFEIFNGHVLWDRRVEDIEGGALPLGQVDAPALALSYEGDFAHARPSIDWDGVDAVSTIIGGGVREDDWMRRYLLDNPYMTKDYGADLWLVGRNEWVLCDRNIGIFQMEATMADLCRYLERSDRAKRCAIVVHPDYINAHA